MRPQELSPGAEAAAFESSAAGLGLAGVIELSAQNRFSGCVTVRCDISTGLLFFRDGEIINAELDGRYGEEAFHEIMRWPSGTFSLEPNVSTTHQTITRSWKFLLMEARRLAEGSRAVEAPPEAPPAPEAPAPAPPTPPAARPVDRVRQIPGVACSVVLTKDGVRVGDDGYETEKLAGESVYLTLVSKRLGQIFGTGEALAAVVQGSRQHLLQLASRQHDLTVLLDAEAKPGAVEAEIRRLLAPKR